MFEGKHARVVPAAGPDRDMTVAPAARLARGRIDTMSHQLVSPVFLFRFSVPCFYRRRVWDTRERHWSRSTACRVAWGTGREEALRRLARRLERQGLSFRLRVTGKSQAPWCRATRSEDSDGLQVWIDTRDTHTIHRASRYCHRFVFLPSGDGPGLRSPVARWLPINRAKEDPKSVQAAALQVKATNEPMAICSRHIFRPLL